MQLGDVRTRRRQEAHQKALEFKNDHQFDEALNVMMNALQTYGPNILLLVDIANLFKFQNEIGSYYFYGRKIEQEWMSFQSKISEQTKCDVSLFLSRYFYDRGQVSRSFYYIDLAHKSAITTDQHIASLAHILNLNAEFKIKTKINAYYLDCLKVSHLAQKDQCLVERALLNAEIEIIGHQQAFPRLEKYLNKNGAVDSGFHSLVIDFILKCLLNGRDLSALREQLFNFLNQINPMELSTFEKIVIQFFNQPGYFLHAQEMSYLQQRFDQSQILDVYFLNYLGCSDLATRADLKALFQLMIRDGEAANVQLMNQKYLNEKQTEQKWRMYLNEKSHQLITLDGMMPLKKDEFGLLAIFSSEPTQGASHLALQFRTQFEIKELVMRLNQKIYSLTGVPDALTITTKEVKLLESIHIIPKT